MHACGHDLMLLFLMGVAEVLEEQSGFKRNCKIYFPTIRRRSPVGEEGGASLMVKEGVLENPQGRCPSSLAHSSFSPWRIQYKAGGFMAACRFLYH